MCEVSQRNNILWSANHYDCIYELCTRLSSIPIWVISAALCIKMLVHILEVLPVTHAVINLVPCKRLP